MRSPEKRFSPLGSGADGHLTDEYAYHLAALALEAAAKPRVAEIPRSRALVPVAEVSEGRANAAAAQVPTFTALSAAAHESNGRRRHGSNGSTVRQGNDPGGRKDLPKYAQQALALILRDVTDTELSEIKLAVPALVQRLERQYQSTIGSRTSQLREVIADKAQSRHTVAAAREALRREPTFETTPAGAAAAALRALVAGDQLHGVLPQPNRQGELFRSETIASQEHLDTWSTLAGLVEQLSEGLLAVHLDHGFYRRARTGTGLISSARVTRTGESLLQQLAGGRADRTRGGPREARFWKTLAEPHVDLVRQRVSWAPTVHTARAVAEAILLGQAPAAEQLSGSLSGWVGKDMRALKLRNVGVAQDEAVAFANLATGELPRASRVLEPMLTKPRGDHQPKGCSDQQPSGAGVAVAEIDGEICFVRPESRQKPLGGQKTARRPRRAAARGTAARQQ